MEISCRELCHKGLGVDSCDREKEGSLAYRVEAGFDATTLSLLDDIEGILADMDDACNDSRTPPPMTHVLHTAPKASSSHKSTLAAFHCNNQGPLTSPQNLWAVVMGARARNFVPFQRDVLLPPDMPRRRATIRLRPSPFRSTLHQLSGRDSDDCTPVSSRDCTPVSSRRLPATPRLSPLRNQRESGQGVDGTSGEVGHGGAGEVRVRGGAFGLSPSHRGLQALSSVFGSTQGPRTPIRPLQASIRFFPHLSPFSQAQFFLSPADSSPGPGPFEMQEDQALPIVLEDEALQSASDGEVNRRGLLLMHVAEEALEQVRDHVTGTVVVREIVFELLDLIFEEAERRDKENHGPAAAENANLAALLSARPRHGCARVPLQAIALN